MMRANQHESHPSHNGESLWENTKNNDQYRDDIELITHDYTERLQGFNREAIDEALKFLGNRRQNHGWNDNDFELSTEAKQVFELVDKYAQSIKELFVNNDISITHITSVAPEKLEGGVLKKSVEKANNYETARVSGAFASSAPIDGSNAYLARNDSGMILLEPTVYIYGDDNIEVTQDSDGEKRAVLRQPNYIYYLNPVIFNPVCTLTTDPVSHKPILEFSEEWVSDSDINIADQNLVRNIEQVKDVTSLLKNFTILCDIKSQGIGMQARQFSTRDEGLAYIKTKLQDGSVRYINQELMINTKDLI